MAPASLAIASDASLPAQQTAPAKGAFRRFIDRLIAARARYVERQIAIHTYMTRNRDTSIETLSIFIRD